MVTDIDSNLWCNCHNCGKRCSVPTSSISTQMYSCKLSNYCSSSNSSSKGKRHEHLARDTLCHISSPVNQVPKNISVRAHATDFHHPDYRGDIFNVKVVDKKHLCRTSVLEDDSAALVPSKVVIKWIRRSHKCDESDHLNVALRISKIAVEVIDAYMSSVDTRGWRIKVNVPRIIRCSGPGCEKTFRKALLEPHITDFAKFNSNTGWISPAKTSWNRVLQALSHFSYSWSGGRFVLCNLQGSVDKDARTITLCHPVLLTIRGGRMGCTDFGRTGMGQFLHLHHCNTLCQKWMLPGKNHAEDKNCHDSSMYFY